MSLEKTARRREKSCSVGSIPSGNNRCSIVPAPGASPERNSQLNCSFQDHYCSHVNVKMDKASGPLTNRQQATTHWRAVAVTRGRPITERKLHALFVVLSSSKQRKNVIEHVFCVCIYLYLYISIYLSMYIYVLSYLQPIYDL